MAARGGFSDLDQSASFSHTYNFRPTLLNSFIFSYNRINGTIVSGAPFSFAELGIPIAHTTPAELVVAVTGYFSVGTGHPGAFNRQNYHFSDSLHWIVGRHEIAVGGRTECYRPGLTSQKFPNAPKGYLFEGDTGCPSGGSEPAYLLLAPRVGFAYNVDGKGKTVIRGGSGMFFQPPFVEAYNNMVDSAPWSPQVQIFGVPFGNPYKAYPNPFPAQYAPFVPPSSVQFILPPSLAVSYTPDWKPGQTMSWNFTVEHQLRNNLLLRV